MGLDVAAFRRRELWQDWLRPRDMYHGTCLQPALVQQRKLAA